MTVEKLAATCGLEILQLGVPETELTGVYCCDLLSIVMGRAFAGCAWVTVMGNINAVAVSSLAEIGVIVLADGVKPDENAVKKAAENGINILSSGESVFETALKIHEALC